MNSSKDIVSLQFIDGWPIIVGINNINEVLKTIGVRLNTLAIPEEAKPILRISQTHQEQLLKQIKLAGRRPAVENGSVSIVDRETGSYLKYEEIHKKVLEKYDRLHVNSADDGTDVDEVMTVVSGGPFQWGFTLKTGEAVFLHVDQVGLDDQAVRVSYYGKGMHAEILDSKQGLLVAFAHGPKEFTMLYNSPDIPYAKLLGANPWMDFSGDMPRVIYKAK
ncbi:unnamed protein product [Cunninghamella echinulata]